MEFTHDTYETAVSNPECEPAAYNPITQFHNAPSWFAQAQTREGYEQICARCGVAPHTDTEIQKRAYGLTYVRYTRDEWLAKDRVTRVLFKLDGLRLNGIEAEAKARQAAVPRRPVQMVRCDCGHYAPAGQIMSASLGSSCPDCYDRMSN